MEGLRFRQLPAPGTMAASFLGMLLLLLLHPGAAFGLESVRLQLAWKHQFQFAGYYAALHQGFYREAGLDVTIVEGGAGKFAREELLAGRAQYGVAGTELILHRRDGAPFVVLAPIFQHSPSVLLVRADSGISHLQALIGRRVMMLPGKKDADILAAFMNEGISIDAIQRLDQTYDLDDLIEGRTDAVSAYITNEPWHLLQNGIQPRAISPRVYGVDFYSDCLFTTESEIEDHPQRVQAFLNASLRGWEYAMAHTEEVIDLLRAAYNPQKERAHLQYEAELTERLMLPKLVQIGHMNPGRWRHIADIYQRLGMLDADFPLEGFLYDPTPHPDYARLKWAVGILFAIVVLVGSGAAFLYGFNRKLSREIRERKEAESALRESEERLRTAGKAAYDLIYEWDVVSDELLWFGDIGGLLGCRKIEIPHNVSAWLALIHPEEKWQLENAVEQHRTSVSQYRQEYRIRHRDGTYRHWKEHALPLLDDRGLPYKWIGVCSDVTESRRVEASYKTALLELERTHLVIENAINGFHIVDAEGRFVYANKAYLRMWGYDSTNEIIGTPMSGHCDDPSIPSRLFAGLKQDGKCEMEFVARRKDGSTFDVQMQSQLMHDNDGSRIYTATSVDVSERKKAAQEKKALQEQLHQAQKMESIGTLAGGIAHDFNNILSSIIGFAELALDEVERDTTMEDSLQEIYTAGKRARDLVKQILAFARQSEEKLKPIQPGSIAAEVLKFLRSTIPATIEIKQVIDSEALIMGNETQVHQVLMNLCTNAAHAMENDGGTLEVSITDTAAHRITDLDPPPLKPGDYIEIQVSDTGVGIPPEVIGIIFDPYFTTKAPGEGTGMGLAVVQGIVESYGGRIHVESTLGEGTTFTAYLPVTRSRKRQRFYRPQALPRGNERILFVDDEAALAKMGEQILARLGYTVTIRTSSVEAAALFRSRPLDFDLVITDMTMPNMAGDQLAAELMEIRPDIPVILCTGYSKKISGELADAMGIKALVYKPIVKASLAKTIREVLDEAKQEQMGDDPDAAHPDTVVA